MNWKVGIPLIRFSKFLEILKTKLKTKTKITVLFVLIWLSLVASRNQWSKREGEPSEEFYRLVKSKSIYYAVDVGSVTYFFTKNEKGTYDYWSYIESERSIGKKNDINLGSILCSLNLLKYKCHLIWIC